MKRPNIRLNGNPNPSRFEHHRLAPIRLSLAAPALVAAWRTNGARSYAAAALKHLRAWFVDLETKMTPHLNHARAIIGVNSGRGMG